MLTSFHIIFRVFGLPLLYALLEDPDLAQPLYNIHGLEG